MNVKITIDDFSSANLLSKKILIAEAALLLYGLFLLIFPAQGLNLSVAFIGIVFIIAGGFCVLRFLKNREDGNYTILAIGVVGIIVGILAIIFRAAIALVLFPILLGIWTLFTALAAGLSAWSNYKSNNGLWWIPALAAIVALVVTIMVFMNLSGTERFMARILGIYFITYNIVRLAEYFTAGKNIAAVTGSKQRNSKKRRGAASRRRPEAASVDEYDDYEYETEYDEYEYGNDDDDDYYNNHHYGYDNEHSEGRDYDYGKDRRY